MSDLKERCNREVGPANSRNVRKTERQETEGKIESTRNKVRRFPTVAVRKSERLGFTGALFGSLDSIIVSADSLFPQGPIKISAMKIMI